MMVRALAASFAAVFACSCASGAGPAAPSPAAASPVTSSKLTISRTTYSFPATLVGQSAASPTFDLSATGSGSLVVSDITSSNPTEFSIANAAKCLGMTIAADAVGCGVVVTFQPLAAGLRSAQIVVTSSAGIVAFDVFGAAVATSTDSGTPSGGGSGGAGDGGGGGGGSTGGGGGGGGGGSTQPGAFLQAPCVPNGTAGITLLMINSTSFVATLTFTGPVTQSATMSPQAIAALTPPPGNYVITGSVMANNATLSPSSWSLAGGCDYLLVLATSSPTQLSLRSAR